MVITNPSFLKSPDRRAFILGATTLLVAPAWAAPRGFCDFEEFEPDPSGRLASDAQFRKWIEAALNRNQIARVGTGRFRLQSSQTFDLAGQHLEIHGAGDGRSHFQRAPGSVRANGEVLMRFRGRRGASVSLTGIVVDMACETQPLPPGPEILSSNFAWQHSIAVEFLPQEPFGFEDIRVVDCEVRDPISDGFSIRGGPTSAPGVRQAVFERVSNLKWPITRLRPRVRGDITVTSLIAAITIRNCILPRLHYEPESAVPTGLQMKITETGNQVGELLAHMAGNYDSPDRIVRTVNRGSVARMVFQGNADTRYLGTAFTFRQHGSRLTGGRHRFERCSFLVQSGYRAPPGNESALFQSHLPVAQLIEIVGGVVTVESGAIPPHYLIQRKGMNTRDGLVLVNGLVSRSTSMQLMIIDNSRAIIRHVSANYTGGGSYGGAFVILVPPRGPGLFPVEVSDVSLSGPDAVLFRGASMERYPGASPVPVTLRRNQTRSGRLLDQSSVGQGSEAARRMGRGGREASWFLTESDNPR